MTNKEETTPLSAEEAAFTNRFNYSMNDKIGSVHWFNTLVASILHIGEFMKTKQGLSEDRRMVWGKSLYDAAKDLLEWEAASQPSPQVEDRIVYVPISVEDETPPYGWRGFVETVFVKPVKGDGITMRKLAVYFGNDVWSIDDNWQDEKVTHWLKPVNLSTLTSIK